MCFSRIQPCPFPHLQPTAALRLGQQKQVQKPEGPQSLKRVLYSEKACQPSRISCAIGPAPPPVALVLVRAFPGPLHGFFSQPEQLRLQTLPQSALHHSPSSSPPHKTPSLPPFLNHSRTPPLPYFISRALAEREDLYLSLSLSLERILCDG